METAELVRKIFPGVPVVLGGIYATLCEEHAKRNIPADRIIPGNSFNGLLEFLGEQKAEFEDWPEPDYFAYAKVPYIAVRSSVGCQGDCSFCGVKSLSEGLRLKPGEKMKDEIEYLSLKYNVKDFVFYDDSLLENRDMLGRLICIGKDIRFHTPNGIDVKRVDAETARMIRQAGFIDPCLSADAVDDKVDEETLGLAARRMYEAGYRKGEVSAYLILGLPGQDLMKFKKDVDLVHTLGLKIRLSEYAVVPGSRDSSTFDDEVLAEPLLHNNSIFPSFPESGWKEIFRIKNYVKNINHEFD
jgi:radical SAM superfamily enzyme YgiQ (UPF0313 family)